MMKFSVVDNVREEEDLKKMTKREAVFYFGILENKKKDWLAGRLAVKKALHDLILEKFKISIPLDEIEISLTMGKKPEYVILKNRNFAFPKAKISIAHTDGIGVGVAEWSSSAVDIGIDLEKVRKFKQSFLKGFLNAKEINFLKDAEGGQKDFLATLFWCIKESYLKALGTGLCMNPKNVQILAKGGLRKIFVEGVENTNIGVNWEILKDKYILTFIKIKKQ